MERIVLTHLSGSRVNQEDTFPLNQFVEITIGRDHSSTVMFDEEAETMVGRQHARITRNIALPNQFFITDLNSRNGTFVNRERIVGTAILRPGDVVQCGIGGPEFRFRIEPETEPLTPPAPTVNLLEQPRSRPARPDLPLPVSPGAASRPAGERYVEQTNVLAGAQSRKWLIVGSGVLMGLVALAAGILLYRGIGSDGSNEAEKSSSALQQKALPDASPGKFAQVQPAGGETAEVEKDAERAAWRIEVAPYMALGSGHPGKAASDFDKPDGVAFSPAGLLLATDAKNRRVQVWDVKTGAHLAEFGHGVFGGEIVDIAIAPDNLILVTDLRTRPTPSCSIRSRPAQSFRDRPTRPATSARPTRLQVIPTRRAAKPTLPLPTSAITGWWSTAGPTSLEQWGPP